MNQMFLLISLVCSLKELTTRSEVNYPNLILLFCLSAAVDVLNRQWDIVKVGRSPI